jgi:beta-glucosidase
LNAGFLNVILTGKYSDGFLEYAGKNATKYTAAELKIISSPNDFGGLNIYAPQYYVSLPTMRRVSGFYPFRPHFRI